MTGAVRLAAGSVFAGDYKVVRALAEGDLRAVYVAEQVSTGKELALKVIAPELVPDDESRAAFAAEVRVGGRIATEHLVDVRAAGIDQTTGFPWLAMELLEGESLGKTLSDHTTAGPLEDWDEILSQICHGLSVIHAAGVVHGGLHLGSVFLAVPGTGGERFRVELLDLGIPKAARDGSHTDVAHVPFKSPEQLQSKELTAAADVWAVGVLAFLMLTGKQYFPAANAATIEREPLTKEIVEGALESASARAKKLGVTAPLPRTFDAWLAKCVARDIDARWKNAGAALEGAADLFAEVSGLGDAIEDDRGPSVKRTGPPPLPPMVQAIAKNPRPAIIAILLLIGIALGGGFGLGAVLRKPKAKDSRAQANIWARGTKEDAQKACDGGDPVACDGLGMLFLYGLKEPRDEKRATELFTKACDGGDMPGCGSLAARYLNGEGVTEDRPRAAELYRKACDRGDTVSCMDLADLYKNGTGVQKDDAKASVLYEKACKEGFTEVCK